MANKKAEQPAAAEAPKENKYRDGRWTTPSKRAKGYAEDRKARVHTYGPKLGKQLTDFEAGMRSGYLQCQTDHSGIYKFKTNVPSSRTVSRTRRCSTCCSGKSGRNGRAAHYSGPLLPDFYRRFL